MEQETPYSISPYTGIKVEQETPYSISPYTGIKVEKETPYSISPYTGMKCGTGDTLLEISLYRYERWHQRHPTLYLMRKNF